MASSVVQPDISYHPDFEKYQTRSKQRVQTEKISKTLPDGFPEKLESSLVWEGKDLSNVEEGKEEWLYKLSVEQLDEIDAALKHFKSLKKPMGYIAPSTFPLSTLHPILRRVSHDVHFVRGFAVLRGLRVDNYTREENIIIYAGISSHVGTARGRQDHEFEGKPADVVLTHIKDLRNTPEKDSIGAPAYTNDQQVFHTDSGDIVSLLALSEAAVGGESQLASSWRVYNELAKERPDLIGTLAENWVVDGFNKPNRPYIERPLIFRQPAVNENPERVVIQCTRGSFTGFGALPRSPNIPPITEAQAEALDALHFLAEKHHIALDLQKGDIQYIHDYSIFHARKAFIDDTEHQRHLLRMWFRDPEKAWEVLEQLRARWKGVYDGVTEENQVFHLEPKVRSASDVAKINQLGSI